MCHEDVIDSFAYGLGYVMDTMVGKKRKQLKISEMKSVNPKEVM